MDNIESSSENVQKVPRRRKCKNHLVQLAEMYPDVTYRIAAFYGSEDEPIYVMEVQLDQQVEFVLLTYCFLLL